MMRTGIPQQEYMTEEELTDFLNSVENKREKNSLTTHTCQDVLESYNCANPFPYKVIILGQEESSGKQEIFHLFTLMDVIKKNPNALNFNSLPPCDIQTQIFQVKEIENTTSNRNYCIELFLPIASEQYNSLRPLYYPATDAFILIFSIANRQSLEDLRDTYLPEVRAYIDSQNAEIPIILVGNHTECREDINFRNSNELVDSELAVEIAQEYSVSKYIEVFSENLFHVQEIFQQTVHAVQSFHNNSELTEFERRKINAQEDGFFRSLLTVPAPEGEFDQFEKSFEINTLEGVDYYYTLDESEPNKLCSKYEERIKLTAPYPKCIKLVALDRCKYASDIATFQVPSESSEPIGYFDPITKAFHIAHTRPNTVYFLTTDGSKPDNTSVVYQEPGMIFDDHPNSCFTFKPNIPQLIRVVAVEQNKFKSKTKSFKPFEVLSQPTVHFNDNMLRIDTQPGVVYRYTTDGSIPSFTSTVYTRPVMLTRTPGMKSLRVAAFPKLYFTSKMVEVPLTANQAKSPAKAQSIKMTKSAIARLQSTSPTRNRRPVTSTTTTTFTSKDSSNTNNTTNNNNRPATSPPRRSNAPTSSNSRKLISSTTDENNYTSSSGNSNSGGGSSNQTNSSSLNTNSRTSDNVCAVTCRAEGTNVEFTFEKYVLVSRIIIKTPGQRKGPEFYEIFMIDAKTSKLTRIGYGKLADLAGEQVMTLNELANVAVNNHQNPSEMRLKKLVCTFRMFKGQKAFKILDMKVDCRVAN